MLKEKLLFLIYRGEGAKLEFTRDDVSPENMAKEIVAFANMNGGRILVGVGDNGEIVGLQKNNFQEWLMDAVIGRHMRPRIHPDIDEVVLGDDRKKVIVVTIPQGNAKPYVRKYKDREDVYVRYGNVCQLAQREQLARLFESGGILSVELFPVHGSSLNELDRRRYQQYFSKVIDTEEEVSDRWLRNRYFLVGEENSPRCSYLSYIMFAQSPERHLPQSVVRLTVYDGTDKDYNMAMDKFFDAPLVEYMGDHGDMIEPALHERVIEFMQSYISREYLGDDRPTVRMRKWDYPVEAIRELLINALIHRDLTRQDYVRIVIYSDRMEIKSPGALPNGMTLDRIYDGEQSPRNPKCVRIFRDYRYLEDQGVGISRKVIPLMKKHNGCAPEFEASDNYFKATLKKKKDSV